MAKRQVAREIVYQYIQLLENKIRIDKVILFGSSANGKIGRNSDLDIIILSDDFKKMNFLKRLELLSRARGRECISVPMDIIGYTTKEFSRSSKESLILGEAKKNGQVIWSR
ncbi:MAG: nucleotidyltransferase domain-containing protein [Elusimicrobiota bacterium]